MKDGFKVKGLYKRLNAIIARCYESLEVCPPRGSENDYVNEYQSLGELIVYREGIEARLALAKELLADFFPWEGLCHGERIDEYPEYAEEFVQEFLAPEWRSQVWAMSELEFLESKEGYAIPFREYVRRRELDGER